MKKIYIVFGQTGEYSDHRDWIVAAYLNKSAAEKRVADCTMGAGKFVNSQLNWEWSEASEAKNPYDEQMHVDYTGTNYFLCETDLIDDV